MHVPPIAYVQIGNLKIMLHFKEQDDGKYIIENYCDCKIEIAGEYTDGNRFPTSKYIILVAEDLIYNAPLEYTDSETYLKTVIEYRPLDS